MIPFEELCDSLARWRQRHGLGQSPSPAFVPTTTEETLGAEATTITTNPLAAVPEARPALETTNEIDVDNLIVDSDTDDL